MKKFRTEAFSIRTLKELGILIVDLMVVAVCFMASVILAQVYILHINASEQLLTDAFLALLIALVVYGLSLWLFRVPKVMWRYAHGKDFLRILGACLVAVTVFCIIDRFVHLIAHPGKGVIVDGVRENWKAYPTYIMIGTSTTCALILFHLLYEFAYSQIRNKTLPRMRKRTLIIGAGYTANALLEELTRSESIFDPVCMLDDDPDKLGRIIHNVAVVGNTYEIAKTVQAYSISQIIFAIPSIDEHNRKRILNDCNLTNCQIKVIPYIGELILNAGMTTQIRDINISDLLGRPQITFGDAEVASYLYDKIVMITGGGGSIGSELCRQIAKYNPRRIVVMDVYENCAYNIQQEILRTLGKDYPLYVEIATMTDYEKMDELIRRYRPQIIFHAAAHKHVPLMETNPEEAVKNNIFGTYNLAKLADLHNVQKFIMISTDKAVNPTNVMGATKRCCEEILQTFVQGGSHTEFASVRFGNVLGSNGSVIPLFKKQIRAGGPVTVTDPNIIRYFMTIPEACSLVLQAGAFAKGGEIFILNMGEPVKIVSLAENLIRMMGYEPYRDIQIEYTGLRPGEKLYEETLMDDENKTATKNSKIFIGTQIPINCEQFLQELENMRAICTTNDKKAIIAQLEKLVPTFRHDEIYQHQLEKIETEFKEEVLA